MTNWEPECLYQVEMEFVNSAGELYWDPGFIWLCRPCRFRSFLKFLNHFYAIRLTKNVIRVKRIEYEYGIAAERRYLGRRRYEFTDNK